MKWFLFCFSIGLFSCSAEKKETENTTTENKTDTMEIIRGFIFGLWSMDSGNFLMNEGYYFKPDGSVDFIAGESTGEWELVTKDTIKISYHTLNEKISSYFKIDSINNDRMILNDIDGPALLRKVPFGLNNEGNVIQGFAGTIQKGNEREYSFNIPSIKKIQLKISSSNPDVVFNVYDGKNKITAASVREWNAIMIKGGKYQLVVSLPVSSTSKEEGRFDLKVIAF